jgi:N-acetylneuraminic acid mutarotase
VWVIGGCDEDFRHLRSVEVWNPQRNAWRTSPSFRQRRYGHVGGVVGGSLVIAGGNDARGGDLASAEAFSPATGWTSLPPMPHAATSATAVVLGGRLYVAGGARCDKLQMWDGTAWTLKADLPAERWLAASVAVDGKMWVIGGWADGGKTASVIIYDD